MRVLLIGGGGFIGSTVADRLLREGHELRVLERPRVAPYRAFLPGETVEWRAGDIESGSDLGAAVEGMDAVMHFASTTLPKNSSEDPAFDVQSNLVPAIRLLESMATAGARRIVFISSGGTVYGPPRYLPVDEEHPTNPIVSYGVVKLAIEKYLLLFERMRGIRPVILRVANPYGERQRPETAQGAVGVFLNRALRGEPIEIWGDGTTTRDYVYIGDVAEAFASALTYEGKERVFNIGSGRGESLNELVDALETTLGRPIERRYLPARPFDVPSSVLSCELARRELGWSAKTGLREGLAKTASWAIGRFPPS